MKRAADFFWDDLLPPDTSDMRFSLIAFAVAGQAGQADIPAGEIDALIDITNRTAGVTRLNIYTPVPVQDAFADSVGTPAFGFQLYFDEIDQLEAAIGRAGSLLSLPDPASLPALARLDFEHQVMLNRHFAVAEPRHDADHVCSYVVHYPGPADDLNAWLSHYLVHHPAILAQLDGVRELEVLTRIDWIDALPWQRSYHMQRNRGAFDSPVDLATALQSSIRADAHADFAQFPPYRGGSFHYPFDTRIVRPNA